MATVNIIIVNMGTVSLKVKDTKIEVNEHLEAVLPYCVSNIEEHYIGQMDTCMAGWVHRVLVPASLDGF
ncbi:hypothetical protein DSO57_1001859 [Entomophthora muscae]|uniref:Uncharacterized protein n=1 Tax=Entomophthora muscae TaxID=34485 RepID=A0ACC2SY01_9FUNG|nr:hypothetical protein DSO57_1001859 [Entomophthora muscae]